MVLLSQNFVVKSYAAPYVFFINLISRLIEIHIPGENGETVPC